MAAILKNGRHLFRAAYLPGCPPRKCSGRCPKHVDTKQPFTAFHVRLTPLAPWISTVFKSAEIGKRCFTLINAIKIAKLMSRKRKCWIDLIIILLDLLF